MKFRDGYFEDWEHYLFSTEIYAHRRFINSIDDDCYIFLYKDNRVFFSPRFADVSKNFEKYLKTQKTINATNHYMLTLVDEFLEKQAKYDIFS